MSGIETVILLLLVFIAAPDLCTRLGRPGLAYAVFVVLGIGLGPVFPVPVKTMLQEIGNVGFLLLLFEIGLEIELPGVKRLLRALRFALPWALLQYPLVVGIGLLAGLELGPAVLAGAALTACSVGMAYAGWKRFPGLDDEAKKRLLEIMVVLEILGVVTLAVGTSVVKHGWDWRALANLGGIVLVVGLTSVFASRITRIFQYVLSRATHWRVHLLVLVVLAIAAAGDRLGLSAAKTAFFLGLFMAHIEHDGQRLEQYLAPVTQRLLIPICFVALGLEIDWGMLASWTSLIAAGTALAVMLLRVVMQRGRLRFASDPRAFLIVSPNLTIVVLAATSLLDLEVAGESVRWLLLTGLFVTVPAMILLPTGKTAPTSGVAPLVTPARAET
jgi:Kef-type K+ transport system membrane component KefB